MTKVDSEGRCQNVDAHGRLCGEVHRPLPTCQGHRGERAGDRAGKQCHANAVGGLSVCLKHGAGNPSARAAGRRRTEQAQLERTVTQELQALGLAVDIRDGESLLAMRNMAARLVFVYDRMVDDLDDDDLFIPMFHHSGTATGEWRANIRVVARDAERDRLAKLDESCVKLGFDQRRLRIAEADLGWLFDAVTRASVVLPAEQQEAFRAALVSELRREPPAAAG